MQQPSQDREPPVVVQRRAGWHAVIPADLKPPDHTRALKPSEEQSDPAAGRPARRDPLVDEILTQISELELLPVEPMHQLDRLAHQ